MKLHLPLSLRAALLAACALVSVHGQATAEERYWVDSSGVEHELDRIYDRAYTDDPELEFLNAKEFVVKDHYEVGGSYDYYGAMWFRVENARISSESVSISGNVLECNSLAEGGAFGIELVPQYDNVYYTYKVTSFSFEGCGNVEIVGNGVIGQYRDSEPSEGAHGDPAMELESHTGGAAISIYTRDYEPNNGWDARVGNYMVALEFKGNDHVYIRGNYGSVGDYYRLMAIDTTNCDLVFAAGEGKKVECYDGIMVDATLWINTTKPELHNGETYTGTVILSGEYAEEDLTKLKGKTPTKSEVEASQLMVAENVVIAAGTLELKEVKLWAVCNLSWSGIWHPYLVDSSLDAEVKMTNAAIYTEWYSGGRYTGSYSGDGVYESPVQYGTVALSRASFTGVNTIRANQVDAQYGTWTFNLGTENKQQAVVNIESNDEISYVSVSGRLETYGATFRIVADSSLENGKYKLLTYDPQLMSWYWDVTYEDADGIVDADKIYCLTESDGKYTLVYRLTNGVEPEARPAVTLTWGGNYYSTWSDGSGEFDWECEGVEDTNFHNGDRVVFSKEGYIEVKGEVLPADILVNNDEGQVKFYNYDYDGKSQITGNTKLTKDGAGELYIEIANAYTGGTIIKNGVLRVANSSALGIGRVDLEGGELDIGGMDLYNDIYATGTARLTGAGNYMGNLTLDKGHLSGDSLNVAEGKTAELLEGSISDMGIGGEGQVLKKGSGTVTLNNVSVWASSLVVESGTLEMNNGGLSNGIVVEAGTVKMHDVGISNGIVVESGSVKVTSGNISDNIVVEAGTLELIDSHVSDTLTVKEGAKFIWKNTQLETASGAYITLEAGAAAEVDTLSFGNKGTWSWSTSTLTLAGARFTGNVSVEEKGILAVTAEQTIGGDVSLNGGRMELDAALTVQGDMVLNGGIIIDLSDTVTVQGALSTSNETYIDVDVTKLQEEKKLVLFTADDTHGVHKEDLNFGYLSDARMDSGMDEHSVWLSIDSQELEWQPGSGVWGLREEGGEWGAKDEGVDRHFYNLDAVSFRDAGEVEIAGEVEPSAVSVSGDEDTIFTGSGSITGSSTITKTGGGTLKISNSNWYYAGRIEVKEGTLEVDNADALGSANVWMESGATFDGGNQYISYDASIHFCDGSIIKNASNVNHVYFEGHARVKGSGRYTLNHTLTIGYGGATYDGDFTFSGGTLALLGGALTLTKTAEFVPNDYGSYDWYSGASPASWYDPYSGEYIMTHIDLTGWVDKLVDGEQYALLEMESDEDITDRFYAEYMGVEQELEYRDGVLYVRFSEPAEQMPDYDPEDIEEIKESLGGLNSSQSEVFDALLKIDQNREATGELRELIKEMKKSLGEEGSPEEALALLDQLGGAELATALTSQMEGNMAHLRRLRSNIGSGDRVSGKNSMYVLGYDGMNNVDANEDGQGIRRTEIGGTLGLERCVREESMIGLALTSGSATVKPTGGENYDEDATRLDFYVVGQLGGGWQCVVSFGVGKHDYSITRRVGAYEAKAELEGYSINIQEEISYTKQINERSSIQPFASFELSANMINAFTEDGSAGSACLDAPFSMVTAVDISLGARYIRAFNVRGNTGSVTAQAAIVTSVGDFPSEMKMNFKGTELREFNVRAARTEGMGVNLGASVLLPIAKHAAVIGSANALLRGDSKEAGASVGVRLTF